MTFERPLAWLFVETSNFIMSLSINWFFLLHVLTYVLFQIQTFKPEEKHATLIFDEMAIKPGLQFDNSLNEVVGRPTMSASNNKSNSDQLATHALMFMLAGVTTRWKQIIAYDFTSNSFSADQLYSTIIEIIKRCHNIKITIRAVVSDMGGQNQALWRKLGIHAGKHSKIVNSIPHPCLLTEKLFFTPDPAHVFKNLAAALTKGYKFILSDKIVARYKLPSNEISLEPVVQLYEIDKDDVIRLCPRLKHNVLYPTHFERMNVALSVALINNDVAAGILYFINEKKIEEKHRVTAWFFKTMHRWFKLLTSRYHTLALSLKNQENYEEAIEFLKSVQDIMVNVSVDKSWKPFQTGVILATETALDFQSLYLYKENFDYVLLGRLTQDCIENGFSQIRAKNPTPDCHQFKVCLRLLCLSQFQDRLKRSNYHVEDSNYVIQYCNELNQQHFLDNEAIAVNEIQSEIDTSSIDFDNKIQSSLEYLIGSIIFKIKKGKFNTCDNCIKSVRNSNRTDCNFIHLKEFKENVLIFPSKILVDYISLVEREFRYNESQIINNSINFEEFLKIVNKKYCKKTYCSNIPECHNIVQLIVKLFIKSRIFFSLKLCKENQNIKINSKDSRSMAMRTIK